jgi:hypothetical protein
MLLGLAFLSSCTVYQLGTLNVANENKTENRDSFVSENDSVKITYSFKGAFAPLEITVENKLNEPIYVNWERSALIFADDSKSLSGEKINIGGNINGEIREPFIQVGLTIAEIRQGVNLSSQKPLTISFIAPKATVKKTTISLDKKIENDLPKENWGYSYVSYNDGNTSASKLKTAKFDIENSPLKFKSYLTIYTANKEDVVKDVLSIQKSFYLAEIKKSANFPTKIVQYNNSKGNMFIYWN